MRAFAGWWVRVWDQREDPRVLALLRISVGLVLLWDLCSVAWLDLAEVLWSPQEAGGLPSNVLQRSPTPVLFRLLPATPTTAVWTFRVLLAALLAWTVGLGTRVAGLVTLLLYAQLAMVLPLGDRGIDMMLRNVLLILLFSRSHATLSVDAWLRTRSWTGDEALVPSWPRHLVALQLVVMYFMAGIQKTAIAWTPLGGWTALHTILQDPHVARFADGPWLDTLSPFLRLGTGATEVFEITAPLMLVVYHLRLTHDRGGRARAFVKRWRPHWAWIAVGVALHVGIAVTMNLGIFPYAMLALYWAWLHPDELPRVLRRGGIEGDGGERGGDEVPTTIKP